MVMKPDATGSHAGGSSGSACSVCCCHRPANGGTCSIEQAGDGFFGRRARDRLADQVGNRDDADVVARNRRLDVGWMESVMTSSCSCEPAMRAMAPPDSTPWVM